ncbi:hypothetical protein L1887_57265 [Cichorium endivia]|nr:hypothetical protein L1887_57265 [Cichorium endivia]
MRIVPSFSLTIGDKGPWLPTPLPKQSRPSRNARSSSRLTFLSAEAWLLACPAASLSLGVEHSELSTPIRSFSFSSGPHKLAPWLFLLVLLGTVRAAFRCCNRSGSQGNPSHAQTEGSSCDERFARLRRHRSLLWRGQLPVGRSVDPRARLQRPAGLGFGFSPCLGPSLETIPRDAAAHRRWRIIAATQLILRCPRHAEPLYNNAMQDQTPHALEGVIQSSAVGLTDRARDQRERFNAYSALAHVAGFNASLSHWLVFQSHLLLAHCCFCSWQRAASQLIDRRQQRRRPCSLQTARQSSTEPARLHPALRALQFQGSCAFFSAMPDPENHRQGKRKGLQNALEKKGFKIDGSWRAILLHCTRLNMISGALGPTGRTTACSRRQRRVDCLRFDKVTARPSTWIAQHDHLSVAASKQAHSHVGKSVCSDPGRITRVDAEYGVRQSQWEIRFSNSASTAVLLRPCDAAVHMGDSRGPYGRVDPIASPAHSTSTLPMLRAHPRSPTRCAPAICSSKHAGSRRPSSWKEANITRSREDAIEQLKKFEQQLKQDPAKDNFASLASVHS